MLVIPKMTPHSIIGALSTLPLAFAHMQMSSPSPLRDPHADRPNEPKDYNILSPLNADGSNFACKGYHLNTLLTTVATYPAGSKQTLRLKGSATHGGGSCQISISCDGGSNFKVIQSMIGSCPEKDSYEFTVPSDIPAAKQCLLAWTWFNRIGNREMYMNCAVVDITNKNKSKSKSKYDAQAAATNALSRYPDLFVANLASINNCKTRETIDVVFDSPGRQVVFGNRDSASLQPSFGKGQCTGKGSKKAESKDMSPSRFSGKWIPPAQRPPQQDGGEKKAGAVNCNDGFYHKECWGGSHRTTQQDSQLAQQQSARKPSTSKSTMKVQQELDAYLATLYGRSIARRNMIATAEYARRNQKEEYEEQPVVSHAHTYRRNCKQEAKSYSPDSCKYDKEDLGPYSESEINHSDTDDCKDYNSNHNGDSCLAHRRTARQKRWASYTKRTDGTRIPIEFHRGGESTAYQQASTQVSVQNENFHMISAEQVEAFLRRIIELSDNMASLIKYAAASTVSIPYYPPGSIFDRTGASATEDAQKVSALHRHTRWSVPFSAGASLPQVYPGPSVGSISAPGDATGTDDGFKICFPNLVQGLEKRHLVDSVTNETGSDADARVNTFDVLLNIFFKAFSNSLYIHGTRGETDPVIPVSDLEPEPNSETLPLEEPDSVAKQPDTDWNVLSRVLTAPPSDDPRNVGYPDFEIPDLDGHYTFPPQIFAPQVPKPELMPAYKEGPNDPVRVDEGPDPLLGDCSSGEPLAIISIEPVDGDDASDPTEIYSDDDFPSFISCTKPITRVGFNSCRGGCNHTNEDIASYNVYLANLVVQQREYEECLQNLALAAPKPPKSEHGKFPGLSDNIDTLFQAPDASGRRRHPGHSHTLTLYPRPGNLTDTVPANDTTTSPPSNTTAPVSNYSKLQPYQDKTLGELANDILADSDLVGPPYVRVFGTPAEPSEAVDLEDTWKDTSSSDLVSIPLDPSDNLPSIDQPLNQLQEAAGQAEDGTTVPRSPIKVDRNALESIADALP